MGAVRLAAAFPTPIPTDGEHTLHYEWDDAHLNTIEHTTDEIDATEHGLRCAVLYRHETHTQVLTPLDAASVVAVAPADRTFVDPTDLDAIRAFVLEPGETVVLHQGTWHWGPFPIRGATSVRLLNVQGRRYAEDNASRRPQRLGDRGARAESGLADERERVDVHDPQRRVHRPLLALGRLPRADARLHQRPHPLERDLGLGVVELVEVQVARDRRPVAFS